MALWEIASVSGMVSNEFLPRLVVIGEALMRFLTQVEFWGSLLVTVQHALMGLAIAIVVSLTLAIMAGRYSRIRRMLEPMSNFLRAIPPPALMPLVISVVGIEPSLYVIVIAFGCIWPIYISASNALASPEPVQLHTARSFGLTDWQTMWLVRIPAALPEAMTGLRLSAAISLLAAVATEMLLGNSGIGALIFNAGFSLLWADMYALMVVLGILGIIMNNGVEILRKNLSGWQSQMSAMGAS